MATAEPPADVIDPLTALAIRHGTDKWGPHFYTPDGVRMKDRATTASILVAYGGRNAAALEESGLDGRILAPRTGRAS